MAIIKAPYSYNQRYYEDENIPPRPSLSVEEVMVVVKRSYARGADWTGSSNTLYWIGVAIVLFNIVLLLQDYGVFDSL